MADSYDEVVAVQRRNEGWIMAQPGVTGVGAMLREGAPVLVVSLAPDAEVPARLQVAELEGVPLRIEHRRYEPL